MQVMALYHTSLPIPRILLGILLALSPACGKAATQQDIIGKWVIDRNSINFVRQRYHLELNEPYIIFSPDSTFRGHSLPKFMISDKPEDLSTAFEGAGQWQLSMEQGRQSVKLVFSERVTRQSLGTTFLLIGGSSPTIYLYDHSQPDNGKEIIYTLQRR